MAFLGELEPVPSFGQRLARGASASFGQGMNQAQQFAEQLALQDARQKSLAHATKQLEKVKQMEGALGTIERMRQILPEAGGITSSPLNWAKSLIPGETQKNRAELESLGRSLIPLVAAGVPIRNQREFSEYSKIITDASSSPSQIEGALNGIQRLLETQLEKDENEEMQEDSKSEFESSNMVRVQAPDGSIRRIPKSQINAAIEAGGKVVK